MVVPLFMERLFCESCPNAVPTRVLGGLGEKLSKKRKWWSLSYPQADFGATDGFSTGFCVFFQQAVDKSCGKTGGK